MAVYTTIDDPSAHFQATIYSGTGSTASVTNGGNSDLQPDLVWIKCRNVTRDHRLLDSSRGVQKELVSNSTAAEYTEATGLTAFQSDGFQHGGANGYGQTGENYVAWQWKANGGSRTTFSESGNNPGGGYQANTTAGFAIVDFTGTGSAGTIAHGLGAVPEFMIVKNRGENVGHSWAVYHKDVGNTKFLALEAVSVPTTYDGAWNDTTPTSSVFTVKTGATNADGGTRIAYIFTPIQGYSKFGSYEGNGNADGPMVFCGFKPAFVLIKRIDGTENWAINDNKRTAYNPRAGYLSPDSTNTETSAAVQDFLSNGFKIRQTGSVFNTSGDTYIYAAFAEQPFVTSTGIPCPAQ